MKTYRLQDLMAGARNMVVDYACVKKGENVCIYADTGCDPLVIEAIADAARDAGGKVVITISDEVNDPEQSGLIDPPKIVGNAFYASDVILSIVSIFKMQFSTPTTARALNEYGARLAYIGPNTRRELASDWARFPAELSFAVAKKIHSDLIAASDDVILADEGGTRLKVKVEPEQWGGAGIRGPLNKPGRHAVLPASTVGTNRIKEANGNVFVDFLEIFGPTDEICEWVIKDSWVTDIKGGPQAESFKEKIFNIKNANLFSQISWGFNPKIKINKAMQPPVDKNKLAMVTRAAGVMHLGLGSTLFHQKGKKKFASPIHTHGILLKPTLTAGKKTIIEKGAITALNDPALRELAKKYGDPDKVLSANRST